MIVINGFDDADKRWGIGKDSDLGASPMIFAATGNFSRTGYCVLFKQARLRKTIYLKGICCERGLAQHTSS